MRFHNNEEEWPGHIAIELEQMCNQACGNKKN
jgi:hypothetical protein